MEPSELDEEALQEIYTWIDGIPLSRPKKNITRDFSDGVLVAEILHHFLPKFIDLHNYAAANSTTQKTENWNVLSRKALPKIGYQIPESLVKGAVSCKVGVVEHILRDIRSHVESYLTKKKSASSADSQSASDEYSGGNYAAYPTDDYFVNGYHNAVAFEGASYGSGAYVDPYQVYQTSAGPSTHPPHLVAPDLSPQHQQQQQQLPQHHHDNLRHHPQSVNYPNAQYNYQSQPHRAGERHSRSEQELALGHDLALRARAAVGVAKTAPSQNNVKQVPGVHPTKSQSSVAHQADPSLRLAVEEREQALLASQETVQILQAKIRRLEHLLHLKDLRIADLNEKLQSQNSGTPRHLPPQQNFPRPPPPRPHPQVQLRPRPPLPGIPRSPAEDMSMYQG